MPRPLLSLARLVPLIFLLAAPYSYPQSGAKKKIGHGSTDMLLFRCSAGGVTRGFKLHCVPADTEVPVLTLMFPNED